MADLVEDLLLLAQLDEGRPLAQMPVDLAGLASRRSTRQCGGTGPPGALACR